jgi:predicted flap endonuclease-1-like 5' DNA nuclease
MKAGIAIDEAVSEAPTRSRESGIMDVVDSERAEAAASAALGVAAGAAPGGAAHERRVDAAAVNGALASNEPASDASGDSSPAASSPVASSPVASGPVASGPVASSPVATNAAPASQREVDIDIADGSPTPPAVAISASAGGEEGAIEVSDEEIEEADPSLSRLSFAPPAPSSVGMRRRPPVPPSSRPRPQGSPSLPPPRHAVNGASRPPGVDPWLLANKTLELSHAQAHIAELTEQVAFRDARIAELEESLAKARRRLEDLESRARLGAPSTVRSPVASSPVAPSSVAPGREQSGLGAASSATEADDEDEDDSDSFGSDDGVDATIGGEAADAEARGSSDDNLQQISGIGPRFEAALRRHGVTRLSQIAAWSDADVRQVAKALKIPKSRIVKGRWVEVAREVIGTRAASE